MIRVQVEDFDVGAEYQRLRGDHSGAVVTFSGCVRSEDGIRALHLEHYPGMTEKVLQQTVDQARERWPLHRVTVIHRIGTIAAGEQIVFVGVGRRPSRRSLPGLRIYYGFFENPRAVLEKRAARRRRALG